MRKKPHGWDSAGQLVKSPQKSLSLSTREKDCDGF